MEYMRKRKKKERDVLVVINCSDKDCKGAAKVRMIMKVN